MGKQPFDGRYEWMGNSPEDIEGKDPDVHQVALCLGLRIREAYPINQVPAGIVQLLHDCESSCQLAEERVKLLIETVSNDLKPGTGGIQYHRTVEVCDCGAGCVPNRTGGEETPSPIAPLPTLCPACGEPVTSSDTIKSPWPWRSGKQLTSTYRPCGCIQTVGAAPGSTEGG